MALKIQPTEKSFVPEEQRATLAASIRASKATTPEEAFAELTPKDVNLHTFSRFWHAVQSNADLFPAPKTAPVPSVKETANK